MGLTDFHNILEGDLGYTFKNYPKTISTVTDVESPYAAAHGECIYADASSGAVSITLPTATSTGQRITLHVVDHTNGVTINRGGSDTIMTATSFGITDISEVDYEFTTIGSGPYDWRFTEMAHRSFIEDYADQAESNAAAYTDLTVIGLATEAYADQAEADAITSANGYTDSAVSGLATTGYVDTAEADANTYTDNAISGITAYGSITSIDIGDTGSTLTLGSSYYYLEAGGVGPVYNLPTLTGSDFGKRIVIFVDTNTPGFTLDADTNDWLTGIQAGSYQHLTEQEMVELIVIPANIGYTWAMRITTITT